MERQRTRVAKTILKQNSEVGGITLPNSKTYKARVTKTIQYILAKGQAHRSVEHNTAQE